MHEYIFSEQTYQTTLHTYTSHVLISLGWKFTFCWTIRAQPHCVTKRAPVNIFPFATAFLTYHAPWSGNNAQHIYTHSLQRNSEISPRRLFRPFYPLCAKTGSKIEVDEKRVFCYLLSITAFCVPTTLHLIFIPPNTRYALKNFRLFSYFSNPVHLLTSENPTSLSHPILASQYTPSHYPIPPRLRNYSSGFIQSIRAN